MVLSLAPFLTQVSYASTAAELSNKKKYPRFFRTCASDVAQAEALVGLVTLFNWRRVSANLESALEHFVFLRAYRSGLDKKHFMCE